MPIPAGPGQEGEGFGSVTPALAKSWCDPVTWHRKWYNIRKTKEEGSARRLSSAHRFARPSEGASRRHPQSVRTRLVPKPAVQLPGIYPGHNTYGSTERKDTQGGSFIPHPRVIPLLQSRSDLRIKSRGWAKRALFRHPRGRVAPLSLSAAHLK